MNASVIVFWIPRFLPDMPGFVTNVEFGYYLKSKKVRYGRPENNLEVLTLDDVNWNLDDIEENGKTLEKNL